ncbi:hypothetical protein [uncultured Desulfobacter sp.]|uniref:hypothetical protein n=1 Tax=uncultured Desulfobacter sp. TaxID=240139 RepID=UPI00374A3457
MLKINVRYNTLFWLIGYMTLISPVIVLIYSYYGTGGAFLIKEFFYLCLVSCVPFIVMHKRMDPLGILLFIMLSIYLAFNFTFSEAAMFAKIASLRQFLAPIFFVTIGFYFTKSVKDLEEIYKAIILSVIIVLVFGFVERFSDFWNFIDVASFYRYKRINVSPEGLPYFWFEPRFGMTRMVSTFLDPINLGHFFVLAFFVVKYEFELIFSSLKIYAILLVLILIGLFLTLSKGAWLQFFLVFLILNKNLNVIIRLAGALLTLVGIVIYSQTHAGFWIHVDGFINIMDHITLSGHGVGTFGNYSSMYNLVDPRYLTGVGDSYWASIIGQFGLIGFLMWIFFFLKIVLHLRHHYISLVLLCQIFISALSENTFNVLSVFHILILSGGLIKYSKNNGSGPPYLESQKIDQF